MKKLTLSIIVLIVGGLVYYFGFNGKDKLADIASNFNGVENGDVREGEPADISAGQETFQKTVNYSSLTETYDSKYGFSFRYPQGFNVFLVEDAQLAGQMITIENQDGNGFQIYVLPFDEPGSIIPERILQDVPDMEIYDPKWADLDGVKTIVFNSYDEALGDTFEVWPAYRGLLYQIVAPKGAEQLLIETLETWRWR